MIKEKEVLERIAAAIDDMDWDDLARLHNQITNHKPLGFNSIEPTEGWHLVPKEGSH